MEKCEVCEREFGTRQGMLTHMSRAHKPSPTFDTADKFERVGRATAILFPSPDPARYIEIAEWQKATLRVMDRE